MTLLEMLIKFIIPFLCALITYFVIPILKERNLYRHVKIGVYAAQQMFKEDGNGAAKFEYVMQWMQSKFKISEEDLEKIIEAVVFEMKEIELHNNIEMR